MLFSTDCNKGKDYNPFSDLGLSYDLAADTKRVDDEHARCKDRVCYFEKRLLALNESLAKASGRARDSQTYDAFSSVRNAAWQYGQVHDEYVAVSNELRKLDEAKVVIQSDAYSKAIQLRRDKAQEKAAEEARVKKYEEDCWASRTRGGRWRD